MREVPREVPAVLGDRILARGRAVNFPGSRRDEISGSFLLFFFFLSFRSSPAVTLLLDLIFL